MTHYERTADSVISSVWSCVLYTGTRLFRQHSEGRTSLPLVDHIAEHIIQQVYVPRIRCYVLDMQIYTSYANDTWDGRLIWPEIYATTWSFVFHIFFDFCCSVEDETLKMNRSSRTIIFFLFSSFAHFKDWFFIDLDDFWIPIL